MDHIYLGFWTNWSFGPVLGLTITTTKGYGNVIIAFMTIFVAFVASRLWNIICIVLHRVCSTTESRDTLHHQRQVILRNASSPGSGLSAFLCLLLAWRGTSIRRHLRLWPMIILASACLLGFMLSGSIFSAISTISGNGVLRKCIGGENSTQVEEYSFEHLFDTMGDLPEIVHDASVYAQCCYNNTIYPCYMSCAGFFARRLPTNETDNRAECPFQDQICSSTNANLRLDTGYIDSNDHIGLNAPASERFAWRYVLHCAPLTTKNYTSHSLLGNDSVHKLFKLTIRLNGSVLRSRRINGHVDPNSDFRPIAELDRVDGDIIIAFLSGNGVLFREALDDDWYQATVPVVPDDSEDGSELTLKYRPLNAASPMGCVQQMQWCNSAYPRDRGCGPLASAYDAFLGAAPLFNLTGDEVNSVGSSRPFSSKVSGARLIWPALAVLSSPASSLDMVIANLGSRSLISQLLISNGIQWPIPINQWQDDVRHWWETALASVQATFLVMTTKSFSQEPLTNDEVKMCQSQKQRNTAHTSFSVFGLSFIVLFGVVTIIISYILEPLFQWLSKKRKFRQYAHLEWVTNGALQLHRLAHDEEHGQSSWLRCDQEVPINNAEALLPSLDISDPEHPMLA
ncbi:hypothetical protein F4782DRAFT_545630 [Xylaria castorea]|nr:hypothetical protein F4782DRAFT_545630 [Xylaria castorea]